ncbi:hypothetical protein L3Q82_017682 [Scortum barcoo]|uniref:Uncharacterized protein n=1 Tax=Scortum barcoo TaxID=214431 RepID=A0ACB8VNL7_9TELE|nr:hypothetical protein L3Q82_017682 [Scortum barcoo]
MAAELGSYEQAHTSSPPLTLGNSRVVEGPAPLKELGSRAQAMRGGEPNYLSSRYLSTSRTSSGSFPPSEVTFHVPIARVLFQGLGRRGSLPRLLPKPHCTGPSWTFLRVVSLLEGGPTSPFRAEPGRVPWAKTRPLPPGARLRAPTPGLAPGWGPVVSGLELNLNKGVQKKAAICSFLPSPEPETEFRNVYLPLLAGVDGRAGASGASKLQDIVWGLNFPFVCGIPSGPQRHRKQKGGKRGGLRARLQANPYRLALPSLFLTNARSLVNKMDKMKLRIVSAKIEMTAVWRLVTARPGWITTSQTHGSGASGVLSSPGRQDCSLRETQRWRTRPTTRTVQVWTEEASSALQDCFECTDWEVFKEGTDLDGYTSSVLSYLKFCTDAVLSHKDHQGFPKSKTMAGQHSEAPTQSL